MRILAPAARYAAVLLAAGTALATSANATTDAAQAAVDRLDFARFKHNIQELADFGDRSQYGAGSASYTDAALWVETQLAAAGYVVQRHAYTFQGHARETLYVTKVGGLFPDRMYIVSAHLDGRGGGGAADDDASGVSLVLEAARILADPEFQSDVSIRFIFWTNEETGLNGSVAYVAARAGLQGIESPAGSGVYPEPTWLGMIQHDMILFDHGLPPQPFQIAAADIDVEYQAAATVSGQALANLLRAGSTSYSTDYPAQVGSNMRYTDSWSFRNYTPSVSVRENQRVAEIGNGANPHWHQPTDVITTYADADFRLGFNALQMTLGTVAELAGVRLINTAAPEAAPTVLILGTTPNPFRPDTAIQFVVPAAGYVVLTIHDIRGRTIRTLFSGSRPAGLHTVTWDGTTRDGLRAASSVYYARLASSAGTATLPITLLR